MNILMAWNCVDWAVRKILEEGMPLNATSVKRMAAAHRLAKPKDINFVVKSINFLGLETARNTKGEEV